MSKKYSLLVSIVLLLTLTTISSAVDRIWDNGAGDGNWTNAINWASDILPNTTSDYARIRMTTGPVFSAGRTATAWRVYLEGTGNGTLTVSGGTLNTNNHIYAGVISTDTATLNMSSGDVNIAGTFYISRDAGSVANINLSGGTITCGVLSMGASGGTGGRINLSSTGKLIITGDVTATITPWITSGWIKAYNGAGTVMYDYNVTTVGKTTVWGTISDKATFPNPVSSTADVPINGTNLSWKSGVPAASHDVYFGTVLNDVNSAERLLGDLNGNGIVDFNDVSRLILYWLTDPAGSEPYAGVNDDNIVDFFDYALFSQDWRNTAVPVFKGNRDTNSFSPGTLAFAATYYWRIDEVNGPNTAKGDVWNFTTQTGKASIRAPANGEQNVLSRAVLVWTAGVGAISHDVYFGTADPPVTLVSDNQTAAAYNPGAPIANSTTYYWRIDENYGTGTVQGDVWNFTTIDAASEPDLVFVQASDPQMEWNNCNSGGVDDLNWGITINKVNNLNPDFMLVTGDLINSSGNDTQAAEYKSYRAALNPTIECYEVPGNHDISEPPDASKYLWWKTNFGYPLDDDINNPWYSFAYGDSFFIGLDDIVLRSPFGGQDVNEMNWLTQTLIDANETGYAHKFVFMHVALFVTSANEAYDSAGNLPLLIRGQLLDLFHQYGVKVVMAGHRHTNNYGVDGDLEMFTTTSCTCGLGSPRTPPGIRIFKVYSDRVEQEIRNLDSLP
jgi:hypothetical protein